jgi:hypothetical protein
MMVSVKIKKGSVALMTHKSDVAEGGDLSKAVAGAVAEFRQAHPETSLLDDDVRIIVKSKRSDMGPR